jgi:hypothetical protein
MVGEKRFDISGDIKPLRWYSRLQQNVPFAPGSNEDISLQAGLELLSDEEKKACFPSKSPVAK